MTADRQWFVEIYERHYDAVLRYAWRRVGPDHAADIVAETFAIAFRRLRDIPEDAPLPWLYRVARNLISNMDRKIRRHGGAPGALNEDIHLVEPDHAETVSRRDAALAALRDLSESERELVRLIAWEGLALAEVAAVLGCSTATARVRLHRARKRIEKLMDFKLEEMAS
ncbi:RNA polymerase sigma factor [Actinoallomurus iriomotensis]|nr:sigma-70 family RNA polymerase sigma factor [Actinoallomurus iriomotensis]